MRTAYEQRANSVRTTRELRANYARAAYANSYEQRANYERELTRELRDAPVWAEWEKNRAGEGRAAQSLKQVCLPRGETEVEVDASHPLLTKNDRSSVVSKQ